mgnify:CR=1 FL=1
MKYLHTMVRVKDLEASLHFYRDLLGLVQTRRMDSEAGRFSLIYLAAPQDVARAEAEKKLRAHLDKHGFTDVEMNVSGGYDPTETDESPAPKPHLHPHRPESSPALALHRLAAA